MFFPRHSQNRLAIRLAVSTKEEKSSNQLPFYLELSLSPSEFSALCPGVTNNEMLLGIFHVNLAHNIVHLASGIVFLLCGMAGAGASSTFFKIFGVVYALVAVLGFIKGRSAPRHDIEQRR
jgi:hypothetical protein